MDFKYLRRSTPVDTDGIRIINGMGQQDVKPKLDRSSNRSEGEYSKSPDSSDNTEVYVTDWAKDEDSSESDMLSPKRTDGPTDRRSREDKSTSEPTELQRKHDEIWRESINGKRRVISQGDLKFDLGQYVACLLPFYVDKNSSNVKAMVVVSGTIIDINHIEINEDSDIPRETKLRVSPDSTAVDFGKSNTESRRNTKYTEWASNLIVKDWKFGDGGKWKTEKSSGEIQTLVVSYKIKLDTEFQLTIDQIEKLTSETKSRSKLPFVYDLQFSTSSPPGFGQIEPTIEKSQGGRTEKIVRKKKKKRGHVPTVSAVTSKSQTHSRIINSNKIIYDTITVDYRYIMGGMSKCKKILADIKRVDRINVTTSDIENYVKQLKLYPGAFIQYSDDDGSRRMSGIANFVVIDHICLSPSDIRFVIRCDSDPTRILAVSRIHAYDVRGRYDVSSYRCFHPLERYIYTIIDPNLTNFDSNIKSIAKELFDPIRIYVVQKSLCTLADMESLVYEDGTGAIHIIPKGTNLKIENEIYIPSHDKNPQYTTSSLSITNVPTEITSSNKETKPITILKRESPINQEEFVAVRKSGQQELPKSIMEKPKQIEPNRQTETNRPAEHHRPLEKPRLRYKYTGISLTSYVKGLAYPDGNRPTQHHEYIFFHSKDYFELDPSPISSTFLEFVCSAEKHKLFRNPIPGDIILAVPFVCDREQFKGKTNLRWFYPTDEFRLLHLYITSNGTHPHFIHNFSIQSRQRIGASNETERLLKIRASFTGNNLCMFDLYVFGLSKNNPTVESDFTKRFCMKYFWWERLSAVLGKNSE